MSGTGTTDELARIAADAGLRRIGIVAWRDLDDPEAGGSELHAHEIARRWADAGIEVLLRTSRADGLARSVSRDGYQVYREHGRYAVFVRAPLEIATGRHGVIDGLVEIWNGMPFLSPVWFQGPKITFLHHVHAEMWDMVLPPRLAKVGRLYESRVAPRLYRDTRVVTLSESSREEIVRLLGLRRERVAVVRPGIAGGFSPGGNKAPTPLVLAVGRLVPVKRLERLIRAASILAPGHPGLQVCIVGEGYERPKLEAAIEHSGATGIVRLEGHVSHDDLVRLYRRAWVVAATSQREGWGLTISEAAACGTPAVVSRIAGHLDAVCDGDSGLLFESDDDLVAALGQVLRDPALRERLGKGALERARNLTWDAAAAGTLRILAAESARSRRPS